MLMKKLVTKKALMTKPVSKVKPKAAPFTLPSSPSVPSDALGDYSWLIYGMKKIGKTSLAAQFPDALFFMFEPGAKALEVFQVPCTTWEQALGWMDAMLAEKANGTLKFKTIIIDTGFEAYQKCFDYICKQEGIEYPRMDNFGKDWKKVSNEFRTFHAKVAELDVGLIVLCHEKAKESTTRTGDKFDSIGPNLASAADDYYRAVIDNVCWYHFRNRERFLLIKGSDFAMAGVAAAVNSRFVTPSGESVHAIHMGKTPKEGYTNLLKAWDNKQVKTYKDETEKFTEESIKESVKQNIRKKK